jgi:D-alanyl-D-alanine carboxypeptidase (penicillin-binding protein 5/6)
MAPVNVGDVVGQLSYYYKGQNIGTVDVLATENVGKATYADSLHKILNRILFRSTTNNQ